MLRRTSSDTSGVYVYDGRGSVVETVVGGKISSVLHYDLFGNITREHQSRSRYLAITGNSIPLKVDLYILCTIIIQTG